MRILRLVHENHPWKNARRSSYAIHQGIDEELRRLGHQVVTLNSYYTRHLPRILPGQYFDQVWWDLNQEHFTDTRTGGWIAHHAPVRLGLFPESLNYPDSVEGQEHVLRFRGWVEKKLPFLTHMAVGDEQDVEPLRRLGVKVRWQPQGVPGRLMRDRGPGEGLYFFGTLYGQRRRWMESEGTVQGFRHHPSTEAGSPLPLLFGLAGLLAGISTRFPWPLMRTGRLPLMTAFGLVRKRAYLRWLDAVGRAGAVLSLPSVFKGYPGRVTEAISQARPVLAWRLSDRPRTLSLFEDRKEILLYSDDVELASLVERVKRDPEWAHQIGCAGQRRMKEDYRLEDLVQRLLEWTSESAQRH